MLEKNFLTLVAIKALVFHCMMFSLSTVSPVQDRVKKTAFGTASDRHWIELRAHSHKHEEHVAI